ncbi:hypothetical protein [Janthinobacterium sp. CG_S6]|uniref:hypothetical protein n=1 Tax=Janthinobacterium sp. CG_S6 TaxID=3071707 RepID=UPI002DF94B19|nr:hypothetical protein [Janthinobacterium sp. CG_S6]
MNTCDHEERREEMIVERLKKHADYTRAQCQAGDAKMLRDIANNLGSLLVEPGVSEEIVKSVALGYAGLAGNLVAKLVNKAIDDDAEVEAIKEVEKLEVDARVEAGLNIAAMRRRAAETGVELTAALDAVQAAQVAK